MMVWLTMIVIGLGTYATRLSFILLFGRREISPFVRRALRFVPPAVLTAIIFPELLVSSGRIEFSMNNYRMLAGLVAALVAWRSKNVVLTILIGMAALILLTTLG